MKKSNIQLHIKDYSTESRPCQVYNHAYIKGELPVGPSYCPWCGIKHEGEIQWDDDKEEKKE